MYPAKSTTAAYVSGDWSGAGATQKANHALLIDGVAAQMVYEKAWLEAYYEQKLWAQYKTSLAITETATFTMLPVNPGITADSSKARTIIKEKAASTAAKGTAPTLTKYNDVFDKAATGIIQLRKAEDTI